MARVKVQYDPSKRPRHGPMARSRWDAKRGMWRVCLNRRGRRFVAEFLVRFPRPWSGPYSTLPSLKRLVASGLVGMDKVESAGYMGVVVAAKMAPSPDVPDSYVWNRILAQLGYLIRRKSGTIPADVIVPVHFFDPPHKVQMPDFLEIDRLKAALFVLPKRERTAVEAYYGLNGYNGANLTYAEIARRMHLNDQQVARMVKKSLVVLRRVLSAGDSVPGGG